MKVVALAVGLTLFLFAVALQAQAPGPKPAPELKKMDVWTGQWTYEGEAKESPFGPAGKISGKVTIRWILNGFYQEWRTVEKAVSGEIETIEFDWYDPATGSFPYQGFQNNGDSYSGIAKMSGNIMSISGVSRLKEKQYHFRGVNTFAADGKSVAFKMEASTDGKNWTPAVEVKYTKVAVAPKK